MIINEKYLQDIDDDDDDDMMSDQPSAPRVMGNANANFDHYVRICYSYMFTIQPNNLTYGTFTEIYDQIDDFMDSMILVTDYHIRITAVVTEERTCWWSNPTMSPNYDSDIDYGKMDEFDLDTECSIYNFTIEVRYNCNRMSFEQFLKIIFEVRQHFKQMYKLSYTTTAFYS